MNSNSSSNQGQITVEAVLVLTILVTVMYAGSNVLRDQEVLSRLVEKPWHYIAGMIENGIWAPPAQGKVNHPNQLTRHGTPLGDPP